MNYAVVQSGGKQYKVSEGSVIEVEKLPVEPGSDYNFDTVLFTAIDGAYTVGKPLVEGAVVTGKVLDQIKGIKIRVAKFKAKARYRNVRGHRQHLTTVQIVSLGGKQKATSDKE